MNCWPLRALIAAAHGFLAVHRYERETAHAACGAVRGEVDVRDGAVLAEELAHFGFGGIEGKVPNITFCIHRV